MADVENVPKPVVVAANQGVLDLAAAALRFLVVIVTALPVALAVLKTQDINQIIAYFRGDAGHTLVAAVIGLGTLLYGLYKTHKRGAQVPAIIADPRTEVPPSVGKIA